MFVSCLCPTFNRPQCLAEVIESFLRQSYPKDLRELIILDDAGQYDPKACVDIPGVKLVVSPHRFMTLGEKRNATAALASPKAEVYAVWDDDDIYLPWHLDDLIRVIKAKNDWYIPEAVWLEQGQALRIVQTKGYYHGAWGFTRKAFVQVHGYPFMQSGQDRGLAQRFAVADIFPVHSDKFRIDKKVIPSYIYRLDARPGVTHLSLMGKGGYEKRGEEEITPVKEITPHWTKDWTAEVFKVWRNYVKEEEGNGAQEPAVSEGPTGES